jgi:hypothetical protein
MENTNLNPTNNHSMEYEVGMNPHSQVILPQNIEVETTIVMERSVLPVPAFQDHSEEEENEVSLSYVWLILIGILTASRKGRAHRL